MTRIDNGAKVRGWEEAVILHLNVIYRTSDTEKSLLGQWIIRPVFRTGNLWIKIQSVTVTVSRLVEIRPRPVEE